MTVRTRFAPSPTGHLHIGGARTALFAWAYARHFGGDFILRIEDTDRERSTDEAVAAILDGMNWLGLDYDEGPFYQTKRMDRYQEVVNELLESGHAYKCYCSKERLEQLREQQEANKQKPMYDRACREKSPAFKDQPFVIRFRNPTSGEVKFKDHVRGEVSFQNHELDDLIIVRSDGTPTYNFTVVIDDFDMNITHVIRGDDHINNTPRQMNILAAMNATIPEYAHVPMILGPDGKRLSKRHGAVSVLQYQKDGYLPEALLNYLVRLGWSHGDQEVFSRQEIIKYFNLDNINRAAATFNPEKLLWLNQHYIKSTSANELAPMLKTQLAFDNINVDDSIDMAALISAQQDRSKTLKEMADKSAFFFAADVNYDQSATDKHLILEAKPVLNTVHEKLQQVSIWNQANIHDAVHATASALDLKLGQVAQPIRVAVTGSTMSPSIDVTLELLGKDTTLKRLQDAIQMIS